MKTSLISFFIGCMLLACKAQNSDYQTTMDMDDLESVQYHSFARSGRSSIIVDPYKLTLIKGGTQGIFNYPKSEWAELKKLVESLNLKQISSLKAPTNRRLSDGAATASITIIINGKVVSSSGFDHGVPPKELEELAIKVLSLAERVEKP